MKKIIAINYSDYKKYGCPYCGCGYAYNSGINNDGSVLSKCGECEKEFVTNEDNLIISKIGISIKSIFLKDKIVFLKSQKHPRKGFLKHHFAKLKVGTNIDSYFEMRKINL